MLSKKIVVSLVFIMLIYNVLEIPSAHAILSNKGIELLQQPIFFEVINGTWTGNISDTARIDSKGISFYPSEEKYQVQVIQGVLEFQFINTTSFWFISNESTNLTVTIFIFGKKIEIKTVIQANKTYNIPGSDTLPFEVPEGTIFRFSSENKFHVNVSDPSVIKIARGSMTNYTLYPEYISRLITRSRYWIGIRWLNATDIVMNVSDQVTFILIRNNTRKEFILSPGQQNISVLANDITAFVCSKNFTIFIDYMSFSRWLYYSIEISVKIFPETVYWNQSFLVTVTIDSVRPIKLVSVEWLNKTYILGYEAGQYNITLNATLPGTHSLTVKVIDIYNLEHKKTLSITILQPPVIIQKVPTLTPFIIAASIASIGIMFGVFVYLRYKGLRLEEWKLAVASPDFYLFIALILGIVLFGVSLAGLVRSPYFISIVIVIVGLSSGTLITLWGFAEEVYWETPLGEVKTLTEHFLGYRLPHQHVFDYDGPEEELQGKKAIKMGMLFKTVLVFEWGGYEEPFIHKIWRFTLVRGKPELVRKSTFSKVVRITPYIPKEVEVIKFYKGEIEKTQDNREILTGNLEEIDLVELYTQLKRDGWNAIKIRPTLVDFDTQEILGEGDDQLLIIEKDRRKLRLEDIYKQMELLKEVVNSYELQRREWFEQLKELTNRMNVIWRSSLATLDEITKDLQTAFANILTILREQTTFAEVLSDVLEARQYAAKVEDILGEAFSTTLKKVLGMKSKLYEMIYKVPVSTVEAKKEVVVEEKPKPKTKKKDEKKEEKRGEEE
ncbi:MAG: hypothetical protein ACTSX9_03960 [Candidatus Njordarchaeales archaeon]